jgi:hypothetical protein
MADEFAKGLGILTTAGLAWMVLAGWFNTSVESFETTGPPLQLAGPNPEDPTFYVEVALLLKEALFWFAIFGALTFWLVIPAAREAREFTSAAE